MKLWRVLSAIALAIAVQAAAAPAALALSVSEPAAPIYAPAGARLSLSFARAISAVPEGQTIAAFETGILCTTKAIGRWTPGALDEATYALVFTRELKATGFRIAADPSNLFETSPATSDLVVAARLVWVEAEICDRVVSYTGGVNAGVEWQFFSSGQQRVVATINTVAGVRANQLSGFSTPELATAAFGANVRALINNSQFRQLVSAPAAAPTEPAQLTSVSIPAAETVRSVGDATGSVVAVFTGAGFGSGFVLADGYVLTNRHVVGDSGTVRIRWSDGMETSGQVARSDRRRDVALVQTDTRARPALSLRTSTPTLGETVFAIGTPLDPKFQNTLTKGIVSAARTFNGLPFIQSDVMVNHGNSGGPLLDETGKVVGITVSGYQPDGAPSGINLFIPIRDALDFLSLRVGGAPAVTIAAGPAQPALTPASPAAVSAAPVADAVGVAAEDDWPVADVTAWIGRNVDQTGWTYLGADQRAAYFGQDGGVSSVSKGVLQGTFRAELFRPDRLGSSVTYSERSVWQLNCSTRQVRQVEITFYGARNLKGPGSAANLSQAAWETPSPNSVAGGVAKAFCSKTSVARAH